MIFFLDTATQPCRKCHVLTSLCPLGEFIRKDLITPDLRLAETVTLFEGEEKRQFLDFVGEMLRWKPERRSKAKDLLEHPFLQMEDKDAD